MVEKALIFYRRYLKKKSFGWSGDYPQWNDALNKCSGYDSSNILEKVKNAALKVKNGEAAYEKDSVLFDDIAYSYPLLSSLLWKALTNNNKLHVIDLGGSLGSTYYQHKKFLDDITHVDWRVVEQPNFVATGKQYFQDQRISFYSTIEAALTNHHADLLMISCTIQYIEDPYKLIDKIIQLNIPLITIDNTPFNFQNRDRITIQKVPPAIYAASYPCWFLNYPNVLEAFGKKYRLAGEYLNDDIIELDGRQIPYRGFLMELKK